MKQRDPLEPRPQQAGYDARKTESEEKPVHCQPCRLVGVKMAPSPVDSLITSPPSSSSDPLQPRIARQSSSLSSGVAVRSVQKVVVSDGGPLADSNLDARSLSANIECVSQLQ